MFILSSIIALPNFAQLQSTPKSDDIYSIIQNDEKYKNKSVIIDIPFAIKDDSDTKTESNNIFRLYGFKISHLNNAYIVHRDFSRLIIPEVTDEEVENIVSYNRFNNNFVIEKVDVIKRFLSEISSAKKLEFESTGIKLSSLSEKERASANIILSNMCLPGEMRAFRTIKDNYSAIKDNYSTISFVEDKEKNLLKFYVKSKTYGTRMIGFSKCKDVIYFVSNQTNTSNFSNYFSKKPDLTIDPLISNRSVVVFNSESIGDIPISSLSPFLSYNIQQTNDGKTLIGKTKRRSDQSILSQEMINIIPDNLYRYFSNDKKSNMCFENLSAVLKNEIAKFSSLGIKQVLINSLDKKTKNLLNAFLCFEISSAMYSSAQSMPMAMSNYDDLYVSVEKSILGGAPAQHFYFFINTPDGKRLKLAGTTF